MVQTTDRSETAVKEPISTVVEAMLFNNKTLLEKERPMYGGRPSLIITDHDKSELNGLCYGLHRIRLVLAWLSTMTMTIGYSYRRASSLCRFSELRDLVRGRLHIYCQEVSGGLQPSKPAILEYMVGNTRYMYTFFRLCTSHFCHAVANHGKFGEHFKGLQTSGDGHWQ
jgi:hypothetical protein